VTLRASASQISSMKAVEDEQRRALAEVLLRAMREWGERNSVTSVDTGVAFGAVLNATLWMLDTYPPKRRRELAQEFASLLLKNTDLQQLN